MTWPEQQAQQGWLKTWRRPAGDDVYGPLRPSTYYRVPMTKSSHKPRPATPDVAWCGMSLQVDPDWWTESGWEAIWGPWYTIEDDRTTGHCSQCGTKSREAPAYVALPDEKAEAKPAEIVAEYGSRWEWNRREFIRKVYAIAEEFGGEVVE